jgi:hypothetical protein
MYMRSARARYMHLTLYRAQSDGGGGAHDGADDSGPSDDDSDGAAGLRTLGAVGVPIEPLGAAAASTDDSYTSYRPASHTLQSIEDGDADGELTEVMVGAGVEDAHVARAQLRDLVDGMIGELGGAALTAAGGAAEAAAAGGVAEATNAGGAAVPTRGSPHVLTPEGKLVSVQQLVAQCNHLRPGEKLSKDRLTRVMQVDNTAPRRTLVMVSMKYNISVTFVYST